MPPATLNVCYGVELEIPGEITLSTGMYILNILILPVKISFIYQKSLILPFNTCFSNT